MLRYRKKILLMIVAGIFSLSGFTVSGNEPITPLPLSVEVNPAKVALGKKLFFDKSLSIDNSISCASCHELANGYGTDSVARSFGVKGQVGKRNSPTIYNSVFNFTQFWDGRADTLATQAMGPITNPVEMGMSSWEDMVDKLKKVDSYVNDFQSVYGSQITQQAVVDAIAEFEKTLITANSPFDQYLRGKQNAISDTEKRGYKLFKSYGCVSCHQGKNVGGNMFQKFGVLKDIVLQGGTLSKDLGRYNVTRNEWDKRVFKVPSLRLAVKTPPYFHDGSVPTIYEAVNVMIKFQLGRDVPEADKQAIIAFLGSLVGELPEGVQ